MYAKFAQVVSPKFEAWKNNSKPYEIEEFFFL